MYGICYITWARLPSVVSWVQFLDQLPAAMTQHQQLDASVLLGMSPGAFWTGICPLGDMLRAGATELHSPCRNSCKCQQA